MMKQPPPRYTAVGRLNATETFCNDRETLCGLRLAIKISRWRLLDVQKFIA